MAKVTGGPQVAAGFRKRVSQFGNNVVGVVGYSQSYGIFVHENLESKHPVGQSKFLEQPFRELKQELADLIHETIKAGKTLAQGILIACLRVQREAQLLTPVDTGALRASAFTRIDELT